VVLMCTGLAAYAAATDDAPFVPPPNRPGQSAWIPVRHQRQELNLCAPTSASMILDHFGDAISPREIKELSLGKPYNSGEQFADFSITFFKDMIAGLARRGYAWREKDYPNSSTGLTKGLKDIERSLDAGIPVIIDTSPGDGPHAFVLSGYSVRDQTFIGVDPAMPYPGLRIVAIKDLDRIWTSREVGADIRAAVFPKPRK
jgi:hypothetical protein